MLRDFSCTVIALAGIGKEDSSHTSKVLCAKLA